MEELGLFSLQQQLAGETSTWAVSGLGGPQNLLQWGQVGDLPCDFYCNY